LQGDIIERIVLLCSPKALHTEANFSLKGHLSVFTFDDKKGAQPRREIPRARTDRNIFRLTFNMQSKVRAILDLLEKR
jgi:hypothetical protein